MAIIDAHQHFWWTARRPHHWPEAVGDRLTRDFTPDDLRPELQAAGIDGTVLVQSLNNFDETVEYLDLARDSDMIRGVVGWVPLSDPAACTRALDELKKRERLVGIRHVIAHEPDPNWLLQDGVIESLGQLSAAGLAFDAIPITGEQFEAVLEVAQKLPGLKIVLNHLGRPPVPEQGWEPWATQIARAAEHRNLSIKFSVGLDMVMRWQWSTDAMRQYTDHVLDLFGANRIMAASNWPVVLLGGSFGEVWSGLTALLDGLKTAERQMVLGGTAERIYGLAPAK
jgi:L-fuconolactonase